MLLFTSCYWFKFEFFFAERSCGLVNKDNSVIFSKVSLRKEDLNSELGSIQQIWTIFKSCHCDFRHFYQIFQNCLNLLNVCGGLWSLIKLFVWFLDYFPELWLGSISSRSTWLYHSTFEAGQGDSRRGKAVLVEKR